VAAREKRRFISTQRHQQSLSCAWATTAKGQDMNEHQTDLDQADEDILLYDVSDEALEAAAASTDRRAQWTPGLITSSETSRTCCC
jgi:hypothetical protein